MRRHLRAADHQHSIVELKTRRKQKNKIKFVRLNRKRKALFRILSRAKPSLKFKVKVMGTSILAGGILLERSL